MYNGQVYYEPTGKPLITNKICSNDQQFYFQFNIESVAVTFHTTRV